MSNSPNPEASTGASARQLLGMKGAAGTSSIWKIRLQLMKPVTWIPLIWGVICGAAASGTRTTTVDAAPITGRLNVTAAHRDTHTVQCRLHLRTSPVRQAPRAMATRAPCTERLIGYFTFTVTHRLVQTSSCDL